MPETVPMEEAISEVATTEAISETTMIEAISETATAEVVSESAMTEVEPHTSRIDNVRRTRAPATTPATGVVNPVIMLTSATYQMIGQARVPNKSAIAVAKWAILHLNAPIWSSLTSQNASSVVRLDTGPETALKVAKTVVSKAGEGITMIVKTAPAISPATDVGKKVTLRGSAHPKRREVTVGRATSAANRVTSPVTALLRIPWMVEVAETVAEVAEVVEEA